MFAGNTPTHHAVRQHSSKQTTEAIAETSENTSMH